MKFIFRFFLFVVLVGALAVFALTRLSYSEGTRAGMVIKVSKKGVLFKTWEGQLNLMSFGAANPTNSLVEVFDFSIPKGDTALYDLLTEVSLTGERVNVHYEEKFVKLPWMGDTKYFVTQIDRLQQPAPTQKPRDPYREGRE